jgi:PAS domain S-box-containing protein
MCKRTDASEEAFLASFLKLRCRSRRAYNRNSNFWEFLVKFEHSKQEVRDILEETFQKLKSLKLIDLPVETMNHKFGEELSQVLTELSRVYSLYCVKFPLNNIQSCAQDSSSHQKPQLLIGYFASDLTVQLANSSLLFALDVTLESVKGKKITEVFSGCRLEYGQLDAKYFASGQTASVVFKSPTSRGSVEFLRLIPDLSSNQHLLGVFAITEKSTYSIDREELFRNAIETMNEGFVLQDASTAILNYNASALRLLELTADQLLGTTSLDPSWRTIHEDGRPFHGESHPAVRALVSGEDVSGAIMGVYSPSNNLRWIRINAHSFSSEFRSNSGLPGVPLDRRVMVTFSDVTQLLEANFKIDTHYFLSPDLICVFDGEMRIVKVNPSFESTLGYTQSELVGVKFLKLVPPKYFSAATELFRQADHSRISDFEFKFRNKSGGVSIISWVAQMDSRTMTWYAVGRDVTAERIRNYDFHQVTSALNISSIVSTTDVRGVILDANSNFCKLSGYSRNELIGSTHKIVNSGYHSKLFFDVLWETIKGGKAWVGDIQNRAKNGKSYWVRSLITPILSAEGEIERFMSIRFDVSSVYENESALKSVNQELELEKARGIRNAKLASLGELSAGIAHEINNPLTIIGSTARILWKYQDDPAKLAQKAKTIETAVERMAKIVRGLKKFSHSSPNSDMKAHKLETIVQESTTLVESKSKTEGVPIYFNGSFDGYIFCDEVEIQQVMVNLISNAIDAVKTLDERWVKIDLSIEGDRAVVHVRDSGSGIPPEFVEKLFLPFFTTKEVGEGTGLGLSIVKGILDSHAASIEVKANELNTCFEIKFPIYTQGPTN